MLGLYADVECGFGMLLDGVNETLGFVVCGFGCLPEDDGLVPLRKCVQCDRVLFAQRADWQRTGRRPEERKIRGGSAADASELKDYWAACARGELVASRRPGVLESRGQQAQDAESGRVPTGRPSLGLRRSGRGDGTLSEV